MDKVICFAQTPNKGWRLGCGFGRVLGKTKEDDKYEMFVLVDGAKKGFTFSEFTKKVKDTAYRIGKTVITPQPADVELAMSGEPSGAQQVSAEGFLSLLGYDHKAKVWA